MLSLNKVLRCPNCNTSSPSMVLEEKDGDNFLYCQSCKRVFARDKMDSFFRFFEGENKSQGSLLAESEGMFFTNQSFKQLYFDRFNSNLKSAIEECPPKVMVDIGCGIGGYAVGLKGLYGEYYGFEPSLIPKAAIADMPPLPENTILLHYDATKKLPIQDDSVDAAALIASYDHIPDAEEVIKDVYGKLKNNGRLIIVMMNSNFWAKRLINALSMGRISRHDSGHYRIHSPDSLIKEIESFVKIKAKSVRADFFFLPNLPSVLSFIYAGRRVAASINSLLKYILLLLRRRNCGSVMIVVFKK